ncbi:MAG: hypothetical protein WDZ69_00570 [Candidatus Pacearchaeota archaeon]
MTKCVYCGREYNIPRGLTLVMNDGTINHLCSSKCRKNMLMKRRRIRWISKAKKVKDKILGKSEEPKKEEKVLEKSGKSEEKNSQKDAKPAKKEEGKN